jgi:hypothetical protein
LDQPIACTLGKDCWVQQYFDHDGSTNVRDYACGSETYDGHDGTDIRIQDTADQADVLASAPGIVKGVRNNMDDRLVRDGTDRDAIKDRECGNGVVIDHAGGWQTQYCHMRKGSVVVKSGDKVEQGTKLGTVGFSGMAAFPHVHLSVRKDGKNIDPFKPQPSEACGPADSLWTTKAFTQLDYRKGDIIGSGFAPGALQIADVEEGRASNQTPAQDWPAMVFYGWAINLSKGDTLTVRLRGPAGIEVESHETLDRPKAQYFLFAGKKKPPDGWPPGEYVAEFAVSNGEGTKLQVKQTAVLK